MIEVGISTEYITLGQFLKFADIIHSGGDAKIFLLSHDIVINNEIDNRRGRKLRENDKIVVLNQVYKIIKNDCQ
ncbi:MAG TPA: S4 domain-containing protein YaaA [Firmicutes bacterium]|nr:S4 domain-containing protein YaaA [Bacillota bacterium]